MPTGMPLRARVMCVGLGGWRVQLGTRPLAGDRRALPRTVKEGATLASVAVQRRPMLQRPHRCCGDRSQRTLRGASQAQTARSSASAGAQLRKQSRRRPLVTGAAPSLVLSNPDVADTWPHSAWSQSRVVASGEAARRAEHHAPGHNITRGPARQEQLAPPLAPGERE